MASLLSFADDHNVNVGDSVGLTRQGVGVAGRAAPEVGVCCRKDDIVGSTNTRE